VIDELVVSEKASGSRCLLDIGAGTGIFAALAGEAGWEVSCVEFSEHGREDIKRRLGPECHVASRFEPDAYSDEHFDLITLWAVFEHMPYAVNTLRAWYGKLKPGGVLAVSTPNTRCLNRCLFGKNWRYFCPPEHIAYYNESVLQRVFGEVGFRPLRAEKFFSREAFFEGLGRFSRLKGIKSLERVVWKTADAMGWGDTIEIFFRKTTQFRTS
jgi:SAM-dependent methyltransferase